MAFYYSVTATNELREPLHDEVLTKVFNDVFRDDRDNLEAEWKGYMARLKTDKDRILGDNWN